MKPAYGYLVCVLAFFAVWITVIGLIIRNDGRVNPLHRYAPCVQLVAGPSPEFICHNGHAYVQLQRGWVDAGQVSPVPGVPR